MDQGCVSSLGYRRILQYCGITKSRYSPSGSAWPGITSVPHALGLAESEYYKHAIRALNNIMHQQSLPCQISMHPMHLMTADSSNRVVFFVDNSERKLHLTLSEVVLAFGAVRSGLNKLAVELEFIFWM